MTETKLKAVFEEVKQPFEEFPNDSLVAEMLCNLADLLYVCDDNFLDSFNREYNTDVNYEDDVKPFYNNPTITFLSKNHKCLHFKITCSGFTCCNNKHFHCSVNGDNKKVASNFYNYFIEKYGEIPLLSKFVCNQYDCKMIQ